MSFIIGHCRRCRPLVFAASDGDFDLCCQGQDAAGLCARDQACRVARVEPADASDPQACMLHPTMSDGYSIGLNLSAVRAVIE